MDPRTIRIKGRGEISVKPDTIRLNIELEGLKKDYESAMKLWAKQTRIVQETLKPLGFGPEDLKTLSFNIDTSYSRTKDGQRIFEGYEFTQEMKLELPLDNRLLGKVLYALADCSADPVIHISFTAKDKGGVKNQLLEKAVEDAKEKAALLSHAAGVALGSILSIDYSWSEINIESRSYIEDGCIGSSPSLDVDFSPEDIDLSDTVTVVWEIL